MASVDLTSHHVNYLIWRYLQESGHGEAAVMLQRAWNPDPQTLPFAPYIKTHALVTLVQKGLQYHEIEQSFDQDGNPVPLSPDTFYFGPNAEEIETSQDRDGLSQGALGTDQAPSSPNAATSRKPSANGQPPVQDASKKDGRKSNGGDHDDEMNGDMDIDQPNGVHPKRTESPSAEEQKPTVDADGDVGMGMEAENVESAAPAAEASDQEPSSSLEPAPELPATLTTGDSVGVQIQPAKAADLGPDTTILDLAGDSHVTQALWRPHDATVLAAAGESFCTLWKLPSQRSPSAPAPSHDTLVETKADHACVTALGWDHSGRMLAVATYNEMLGSVTMYSPQGAAIDLLPGISRMVSGIHWAEKSLRMVAVLFDGENSELALWDQSLRPDEFPPAPRTDGQVYDVAWSGEDQLYACGDGSVYECQVDSQIHINRTFNPEGPRQSWTFVKAIRRAESTFVVTASAENASIWVPTQDLRLNDVHQGNITAIELRPQTQTGEASQTTPLVLATSSLDETIKLWNIDLESKKIECTHRLSLGPSSPALVSTFSPDGYAVAAASKGKLCIWNADRGGEPMATWTVPDAQITEPEKEATEETDNATIHRSLAWDTDGKKLCLSLGNQMAIINLQR